MRSINVFSKKLNSKVSNRKQADFIHMLGDEIYEYHNSESGKSIESIFNNSDLG